jgi:hypothetical protein
LHAHDNGKGRYGLDGRLADRRRLALRDARRSKLGIAVTALG